MSNICNLEIRMERSLRLALRRHKPANGPTGWYLNANGVEVTVTLPGGRSQGAELTGYYSSGSSPDYTPGAATEFRLTNPDDGSTYTGQIGQILMQSYSNGFLGDIHQFWKFQKETGELLTDPINGTDWFETDMYFASDLVS